MTDRQRFVQALASGQWVKTASSNLLPSAIASWDPLLRREQRLLVPVDVQALVVPADQSLPVRPTSTVLPAAAGGWPAKPAPFAPAQSIAAGVHLHIAMPDGLTRAASIPASSAVPPPGNPSGFRVLPDRVVVVRMLHGSGQARSWVLEADLGEKHDLFGWTEPGPRPPGTTAGPSGLRYFAPEKLTPAAGGDLTWAATYDSVLNRFAILDDLADLTPAQRQNGRFSYLVAAWWSHADLDPLAGASGLSGYADRALSLGWDPPPPENITQARWQQIADAAARANTGLASPPAASDASATAVQAERMVEISNAPFDLFESPIEMAMVDGPAAPQLVILHGALYGVSASGAGPDLRPDSGAIDVAIGGSAFGALSAMLAQGTGDARLASERALTAFAANLMSSIDAPGGLALVDEERHMASFIGLPGGSRAKPDRVATGDPLPFQVGGGAIGGAGTGAPRPRAAPLERKVTLEKITKSVLRDLAREKRAPSRRLHVPRAFRDVDAAMPRFFVPTDPVFMIRGAGRSLRHGGDGRDHPEGLLACRLSDEIGNGYDGILEVADLPPALRSLGSGAIPPEVDALLSEAVLDDPYRDAERTAWARSAHGLPEAETHARFRAETLVRWPSAQGRFGDPTIPGLARDEMLKASAKSGVDSSPIGRVRWAQPWVPMWCEIELALALDDAIDGWALDAIDLDPQPGALPTAEQSFQVRVLINASSARALGGQIDLWLKDEDERDAKAKGEIDATTEDLLATASRAAKFLDVLHGSFEGLRLELLGLDRDRAGTAFIDDSGHPITKPRVRALPRLLAGGQARIVRFRIVDTFGRWVDLPSSVLDALEVAATHVHPDGGARFLMHPRIQSPARILFRFIDPATTDDAEARIDQEHPDLAISPISGWLLPDHVDESLEFYDADGTAIGQLLHDPLTNAVVWEGARDRRARWAHRRRPRRTARATWSSSQRT
jgi:hypothetical protein